MSKTPIPGLEFKGTMKHPIVDNELGLDYEIPLYKDNEYFAPFENFTKFAKNVESKVRHSPEYKKYKGKLHELGLTVCQVQPGIELDDDGIIEIEMHHGPILTLFDVVTIMMDSELYHGRAFTTLDMTDMVIQEHYDNNIQVVMLSKTDHEHVHTNNIFLNMKHGFGNINRFIKKYAYGISPDMKDRINEYIRISLEHDSNDGGILELRETLKKYGPA